MKRVIYLKNKIGFFPLLLMVAQTISAQTFEKALRITDKENQNQTNTWLDFVKTIDIKEVPKEATARIACDSKYWLWINGNEVVFEGQLKRGPTPVDTYYDEINLSGFLKTGENRIAILVWYFGKDGFSHKSSGQAGLVFECEALSLYSDDTWLARTDRGFENTNSPYPNFRLSESNIRYNAQKSDFSWIRFGGKMNGFRKAVVLGKAQSPPWNKLVKRPTPLLKNFGLRDYIEMPVLPFISNGDTIICKLPYNAQVTPYFKIDTKAGSEIGFRTDHYFAGGPPISYPQNVRGEYVTRDSVQEYESLGWMNGEYMYYYFPKGVKILELKFRESGYNTEFSGNFACSDPFYNKLWQKALRTLYVTMRDTYMDCPDRERSQWWGDMVNESGEAFYALSPSAALLTKKGILELINWQRKDGTIFSPIPAGNWNTELPDQMLAAIGYFGFWNYYLNTGDKETIENVYAGVKRYLDVWKLDTTGILKYREGDWYWGDWGTNIDKQGLFNAWYYLALKGFRNISELLGKNQEVAATELAMTKFRKAFNQKMWNGKEYRSPGYNFEGSGKSSGDVDDRFQSLAVVAGLVDSDKYPIIYQLLQTKEYASPYMEKYVIEALFKMGYGEYGLERLKKRFSTMVNDTSITTLYEGWGIGPEGYGGGSTNHAWSGGGLTILSQYVCGLSPVTAAWETFKVKPMLSGLTYAETGNITQTGKISVKLTMSKSRYTIEVQVPNGSTALVYLPDQYNTVTVNGSKVFKKIPQKNNLAVWQGKEDGYNYFKIRNGYFTFVANR